MSIRRRANAAQGDLDKAGTDGSASVGKIGGAAKAVGVALGGLAVGAVAGGVAIVKSSIESGRELRGLAQAARLNVEDLQAMGAVARETGGSVEDIADASRELQLRLSEATSLGTGPAVDALNLLGLGIEHIQNLSPEKSFALIRDRLSEIEDPAQRAFLAEELLGGSTERLTGFIETNTAAFRGQIAAVRASGQVISEDAVQANAAAADAVDSLRASLGGLAGELTSVVAPAIGEFEERVRTFLLDGQAFRESILADVVAAHGLTTEEIERLESDLTLFLGEELAERAEQQSIFNLNILAGEDALNVAREQLIREYGDAQSAAYDDLAARHALLNQGYIDTERAAGAERIRIAEGVAAGVAAIYGGGGRPSFVNDIFRPQDNAFSGQTPTQFLNAGNVGESGGVPGIAPGGVLPVRLVSGGSGGGGARDPITKLTAEQIATRQQAAAEDRFFEQIETLYANNRINEDQYQALLMSNDLDVTLAGLVEGASKDELGALDQVRTGLRAIGEIDAEGSRAIVRAIGGIRAALADVARLERRSSRTPSRRGSGSVGDTLRGFGFEDETIDTFESVLGPGGIVTHVPVQVQGVNTVGRPNDFLQGDATVVLEIDGQVLAEITQQQIQESILSGQIDIPVTS